MISLILRHEPERIGVELQPGGYVFVSDLLAGLARQGTGITREDLDRLVRESDKQRFSFDASGERIRANQGHSVEVDLQLEPRQPPEVLFHGTTARALEGIRRDGLRKMKRHAVHLSPDVETAIRVGGRRGKPLVLRIQSGRMHAEGHVFYCSENGVWLTDEVPPAFIEEGDWSGQCSARTSGTGGE